MRELRFIVAASRTREKKSEIAGTCMKKKTSRKTTTTSETESKMIKNFVPGRKVMTCCAEDTQFIGYISFYNNIASLENREWIWVTATIKYEFQMAYKKKGPVLYVESVEKTGAPKEEMVFF